MKFFSSLSLRKKLMFLILVAALPTLVITLFSGLRHREHEIFSSKQDIMHLVQSLAAQHEQLADSTRLMLQTLAQLPEVQKNDVETCNRIFRDIHEKNPIYSIIAAATPDGDMFAASAPFTPGGINIAERKNIRDVIRTRDFSVGEYIVGKVSMAPAISFTFPVLDKNRELIAIVLGSLKLDKFKEFMTQLKLPEGYMMSIVDHKNILLYRFPENERTPIGMPIPLETAQRAPDYSREGFVEGIGRDGVSRIYAYKRLSLRDNEPWYLTIYVGVDKSATLYQANVELVLKLAFLGIASLFAILVVWIGGNSILLEPIDKLVTMTKRFGEGQMHVRTDFSHRKDELGLLANSFDTMAAKLEISDFERKNAENALLIGYDRLEQQVQERTAQLQQKIEAYKQLQADLHKSEEKFRTIADWSYDWAHRSTSFGIFSSDMSNHLKTEDNFNFF